MDSDKKSEEDCSLVKTVLKPFSSHPSNHERKRFIEVNVMDDRGAGFQMDSDADFEEDS